MLRDQLGIDHHADRDEEYRAEDVAQWRDQMLYLLDLARLRDERARQERAESDRIAGVLGQQREGETNADDRDQRRLRPVHPHHESHDRRHDDESDADECDEEQDQARDRHRHQRRRHARARGQRGQNRELDDRGEIFGEQNAEDQFAQAIGDGCFLVGLGDDGGARDGKDRAGEDALERRPSERASTYVTEPDHEADLQRGDEARGRAEANQFAHTEFESEREHQEDHAELGKRVDALGVGEQRNRNVGADDQAGDQIADDDRLADFLENDRGDGGDA